VRGRIVRADRLVVAGGEHLALTDQHRAHRHFADRPGVVGLVDRQTHEGAVARRLLVGHDRFFRCLAAVVVAHGDQAACRNSTQLPSGSSTIAIRTPGRTSFSGTTTLRPDFAQASTTSARFVTVMVQYR